MKIKSKPEQKKNSLNLEIKEYKNKYRLASEKIYDALGDGNYANVFNCMTRFRANIANKSKVDIEAIKDIDIVKGINWSGDQIQIIIGGEVIKVVDEFKKYEEQLKTPSTKTQSNEVKIQEKKSIGTKLLSFITGVMGPSIAILMASGMFSALYSILSIESFGILTTATPEGIPIGMENIYMFDIWSSLFFILNKVLLGTIGLFFIYNTARYLRGDVWIALAVGLILLSRAFFPGVGAPLEGAKFGTWINDASDFATGYTGTGKMGFFLFQIGTYPIVVGGYESAIIPFMVGGFVVTYLDKWVKTWMPATVDILFRPFLVILVTVLGLWFLLGPIAALIEYGLSTLINLFGKIPYGFGTALVAFFWQPLVLTGAHAAAVMPLITDMITNPEGSMALAAVGCGVWAQLGAVIGVAIMTKNANLRRVSISTIPAGIFGVTEPIIYGVTLPKVKPFIMGCLGGAVGGFVSGILGVAGYRMGGSGILGIISAIDNEHPNLWWQCLITWNVSIGAGTLFSALTYTERKNEVSCFKKGIRSLSKFTKIDKALINKEFETKLVNIKSMKDDYKKMDKYYSEVSKYENQLINIETQESKHREKMYNQLMKLQEQLSKKENQEKLNHFIKLNDEYSTYNLDKEKSKIKSDLNNVIESNKSFISEFNDKKESLYKDSTSIVKNNKLNEVQALIVNNTMWNGINAVEIGFGIEDAKPTKFKKGK